MLIMYRQQRFENENTQKKKVRNGSKTNLK